MCSPKFESYWLQPHSPTLAFYITWESYWNTDLVQQFWSRVWASMFLTSSLVVPTLLFPQPHFGVAEISTTKKCVICFKSRSKTNSSELVCGSVTSSYTYSYASFPSQSPWHSSQNWELWELSSITELPRLVPLCLFLWPFVSLIKAHLSRNQNGVISLWKRK